MPLSFIGKTSGGSPAGAFRFMAQPPTVSPCDLAKPLLRVLRLCLTGGVYDTT